MSRYHRIWVVYRKELIDTLRDRRTLIAMVVVPIVLYPVLMLVLVEALRTETGRRQAERYSVAVPDEAHRLWLAGVLEREDDERAGQQTAIQAGVDPAEAPAEPEAGLWAYLRGDQVDITVVGSDASLWNLVYDDTYQVALILDPPPDPEDPNDLTNRVAQFIYRDTDPRSEFLFDQLSRIASHESDRVVRARLAHLPRGAAILTPLLASSVSTASPEQQFAKVLAMVVPFLLVTITITGAMYPAIDLTAGERERGTLETLAVAPVPVGQIIAGKFGVIVSIAMFTTVLNLGSMTAMVHFTRLDEITSFSQSARKAQALAVDRMIEQRAQAHLTATSDIERAEHRDIQIASPSTQHSALATGDSLSLRQWHYLQERHRLEEQAAQKVGFLTAAVPVVLLTMIPFAVLFGAVMLAACSFARTFKEAQNYMMPVMMAAILPAMVVSYMPSVRLEGLMLVIPVANVVVMMRELFLGNYAMAPMGICLLSTCLYAAAAVSVAARVYGNEAVLFSDVGSYKVLFRRRFFRPQTYPPAALALLTVALIFPFNFYWQSYLLDAGAGGARFKIVITAAQVLIFAGPVLLLTWYLKLNWRRVLSLQLPCSRHFVGVLMMAIAIVPVSFLLQQIQQYYMPASPTGEEALKKQAELMTSGSLWAVLLAFAVVPGVCEELLFRGFLLAGLRQRLSTLKLILIVGVVFGLYHIHWEKIPIVSLMGMLLTLVCVRSGSIFLAMLLHMSNNGLGLAAAKADWLRLFYALPDSNAEITGIHCEPRTAVFVAGFLVGLTLILRTSRARSA